MICGDLPASLYVHSFDPSIRSGRRSNFKGKPPGECPVDPTDILRHLTAVLDELDIPYFITGSVATILFGEPRMTQDVDVVADFKNVHVKSFCHRFPEEKYYLSEDAVRGAQSHFSQFNIIDIESGFKADIMVPDQSPLNRSRFQRRRRLRMEGEERDYWFSSPEDIIIKKMDFYREGGSDKHLRDITGVLKTTGDRIDHTYINEWVITLRLQEIWQAVLDRMQD